MKKLFKAVALFAAVMAIIISYSLFDIARTTRVTIVVTGVLQGNIISFKATGEPYKGMLVGGMPFLVAKINELRKKAIRSGSSFHVIDAGDDFPGTAQSYYSQCRSVVDTMNLMGISAMSLGNREFDYGPEVLAARAREARFPILAANVRSASDRKPFDHFADDIILRTSSSGIGIGVLGMAPPETVTDTSARNLAGIHIAGETETISVFKKKMADAGAAFTIAVTQIDIKKDSKLFEPFVSAGIDMAIGLDFYNDINRAACIGRTLIVPFHGLSKGTEITKVDLVFDTATRALLHHSIEKIPIIASGIEPDRECSRLVADYLRKLDAVMNEVVGYAECDLKRPFNEETNLGNLVCDLMLQHASAEVALQNSGSFRAEINRGEITVGNLYDVLPFDNDLVVMEVDGATLREIMNACCVKERGLLQIAGGSYEYDPNRAAVRQGAAPPEVLKRLTIGGAEVDPARRYRVAVNSFIASGQGGYPQFKKCRTLETLENVREIVERRIRALRRVDPRVEGRITRAPAPAGGVR